MRKLLPEHGWWALAAAVLFLAHASVYAYFFVDDEGITLVYARHLLDGHGLSYAVSEGPSEGYSNLLHVIVMSGVLGLVRLAGLAPIWTFAAGDLISLTCGAALVVLVWQLAARLGFSPLARTTGALLLAASGPLAVWSNSSLETVPFALAFMTLVAVTLPDIQPRATSLLAAAVMLMRIDGALYVAVWLAARFAAGDATARRALLRRVAPAVIATGVAYTVVRFLYFGDLLPLPLQTKVAHKLADSSGAVVWTTSHQYLLAFLKHGAWPLAIGLAAVAAAAARGRRHDAVFALAGAVAALGAYVSTVGDWMFGFRFFVPLLAPLAVLSAAGASALDRWRPRLAQAACAGAIAWAIVSAAGFQAWYQRDQQKPSFWAVRVLDPALKFGEYYEAYRALRPLISDGARIAYHEAGFVPFVLGVENVDMLGLTSRFIGSAPTADAIHTDVGRYYPVTPEPAYYAVHAYLLSQQPEFLVMRRAWMRTANFGQAPDVVLNGHYRLEDATPSFAIYRRTERPVSAHRRSDEGFLENFAHPAYADRLTVEGARFHPDGAAAALPFLWGRAHFEIAVDPEWRARIDLRGSASIHEIYLEGLPPPADIQVEVSLRSRLPASIKRLRQTIEAGRPLRIHQVLDAGQIADDIEVRLVSPTGQAVRVTLVAVRVMGQSDDLQRHVRQLGERDSD